MTQIETPRLILRPWRETDSPALYAFARDPEVGPRAGWTAHGSVAESLEVIRTVFSAPEHYAIVPKRRAGGLPVGAVGLMIGEASQLATSGTEAEIGYWIGRPFWGRGYMPEAVEALIDHAFRDLRLDAIWCGYYEGNEQSRRVQEKAGLSAHHVRDDAPPRPIDGVTREHVTRLTRAEWELARRQDPTDPRTRDAQRAERDEIVSHLDLVAQVRAGGQTGADRGGLDAARAAGVAICGWCPAGGLAEDMPEAPGLLAPYPELRETPSAGYMQRTAWNVRDSHATLVVAPDGIEPASGTEATVDFARAYGRPVFVAKGPGDAERARTWLEGLGHELTLNVAGPRGSKVPTAYQMTFDVVSFLLAG